MTANHSIDPAQFLSEHLEHDEPDDPRRRRFGGSFVWSGGDGSNRLSTAVRGEGLGKYSESR